MYFSIDLLKITLKQDEQKICLHRYYFRNGNNNGVF